MIAEIASIIAILSAAVAGTSWFYRWAYNRGMRDTRRAEQRLSKVYGPLRVLLTDTYVAGCRLILYPTFRTRFRRACRLCREGAYRRAVKALFDKGVSDSGVDIEWGRPLPLADMGSIIEQNAALADPKLLDLYQAVRREQTESESQGSRYPGYPLTKNYLCLMGHIEEAYERLCGQ